MKTLTLFAAIALTASTGIALAQTNQAAASGNDNQAVATTSANAATPAHGSNSFTRHEAMHRIAKHGYTEVKDLTKDSDGVWRGSAMQNGAVTKVWLDYKGNVGTE